MKKLMYFFALAVILCLIPLFSALAQTGTVTADTLNIRASASTDSNVVGVVHSGDKVTIKDNSGSWYRISCNGKSGYVYKKYVSVSSGGSSGGSSSGSSSSGSYSGSTRSSSSGSYSAPSRSSSSSGISIPFLSARTLTIFWNSFLSGLPK